MRVRLIKAKERNEHNLYIFLMFCLLSMSEEKNVDGMVNADGMVYILVSSENIERMKAIGKMGNTFDDVVTMLLDYYEDLRRQEWVNTKRIENQYNEQISE